MSNMWLRLIGESILGFILLVVGIVLFSQGPETTAGMAVAIGMIILGIVLILDLFYAASTGKMTTPPTLGAGTAPAGTSAAERYARLQEQKAEEAERAGLTGPAGAGEKPPALEHAPETDQVRKGRKP